jgi:hypothetical protein
MTKIRAKLINYDSATLEDQAGKLAVKPSVIAPTYTSPDGSIAISGSTLQVVRAELELFADNETQLLVAWAIAIASSKAARIYITNSITFSANRQFIQPNSSPQVKLEAITQRNFDAASYTIDFNNIVFTNITFRTAGTSYIRLVGGYGTFNNCAWTDDTAVTGSPKKNIIVSGTPTANTSKIVLKNITHYTQSPTDNTTNVIQPFWIENQSAYTGGAARLYVEVLEMSAVFEFARFARVLLTSTVAGCPFSVTGDESWFYDNAQSLPGFDNIATTAAILRTTTVDKFNAARLATDNTVEYVIGMKTNGDAVKRLARSDDWYGIQWDTAVSSPLCTRIGSPVLHRDLPIQSAVRGCLLSYNYHTLVNYYLDPLDWTKKADGSASVLDGTNGQVMVEIPSHYRKFESSGTLRTCKLSEYPLAGYQYVRKQYISAFEASLKRDALPILSSVINLSADYRGGDNTSAWDAAANTLLGRPATSISRTNFRTYARQGRNTDWNLLTYDAYKTMCYLFYVEYANFNSQAAFTAVKDSSGYAQGGLGNGVTNLGGEWAVFNGYNPFVPCGYTNSLANASGEVTYIVSGLPDTKPNRYRGIENPFGHIWKWVDGINVETQSAADGGLTKLWTCEFSERFQDNNYLDYVMRGNLGRVYDYVQDMLLGEMMPSVQGGGAGTGTYFCDHSWMGNIPGSGTDLRGVIFGGAAFNGADAGLATSSANYAPSYTNPAFGSRLCFLGV